MTNRRQDERAEMERRSEETRQTLLEHIGTGGRLAVVKAPPGSGKTHLLVEATVFAYQHRLRVAVACQKTHRRTMCAVGWPAIIQTSLSSDSPPAARIRPTLDQVCTGRPTSRNCRTSPVLLWQPPRNGGRSISITHSAFCLSMRPGRWPGRSSCSCGQVSDRFVLIGIRAKSLP